MPLIINNVISASQEVTYDYVVGSKNFAIVKVGTYNVNISDLYIDDEAVLLGDINAIVSTYSKNAIVANIAGHSITRGRLKSISVNETNLTGDVIVDVVIEEREIPENYSGPDLPRPQHINEFSDNFSFQKSQDSYSYTRQVTIGYLDSGGLTKEGLLAEAKVIADSYYLINKPQFGFLPNSEDKTYDKEFYSNKKESVDLANLKFSFSETFNSGLNVDVENSVIYKSTTKDSVDERGYLTRVISIDLTSINYNTNTTLKDAVKTIIDLTIAAETDFGDSAEPIDIQKGFSIDGQNATISISFSNQPKNFSGESTFSVSRSFVGDETKYSLSIKYSSDAGESQTEKFNNTKALWTDQSEQSLSGKVRLLFFDAVTIYEISRGVSFNRQDNIIEEIVVYSNSEEYNTNTTGILKESKNGNVDNQDINSTKLYQHEVAFDLLNSRELIATRRMKRKSNGSLNFEAIFNESKIDTVLDYIKAAERKSSMINFLINDLNNNYDILNIQSDVITVDYANYRATRQISFEAA